MVTAQMEVPPDTLHGTESISNPELSNHHAVRCMIPEIADGMRCKPVFQRKPAAMREIPARNQSHSGRNYNHKWA